jgi:hypothetical protein
MLAFKRRDLFLGLAGGFKGCAARNFLCRSPVSINEFRSIHSH